MKYRRLWKALAVLCACALAATGVLAQGALPLYLPVVLKNSTPGAPLVTASVTVEPSTALELAPFDVNQDDLGGPLDWSTRYGKSPEIIVASTGVELDVLAQDYDSATAWKAMLLHIKPVKNGYKVTQALKTMPFLDLVMGLDNDASGNRYYATAVDETARVNATYPPTSTYRTDIVRVIKLDPAGKVLFNIDLDIARHQAFPFAEMIINPMVFGSARLAVGGGEIGLVHSINTDPDPALNGTRHQKGLSTRLDAATGAVTQPSNAWVSHSFDQRLLYDGKHITELMLGDAYPRYISFSPAGIRYPLFHIKGSLGDNETHTRLGNLALIEGDATYGYLGVFVTESTAAVTGFAIDGPRNLAMVRVNQTDFSLDPSLPDTLTVTSSGVERTNRLRWLTRFTADSNRHAERPKLVGLGGDKFVVLWEQWTVGSYSDTFNGVYGMVIDAQGSALKAAKLLTTAHHLPRGDDAFPLDGRAAWMTGNTDEHELYIHFVDDQLNYVMVTVEAAD